MQHPIPSHAQCNMHAYYIMNMYVWMYVCLCVCVCVHAVIQYYYQCVAVIMEGMSVWWCAAIKMESVVRMFLAKKLLDRRRHAAFLIRRLLYAILSSMLFLALCYSLLYITLCCMLYCCGCVAVAYVNCAKWRSRGSGDGRPPVGSAPVAGLGLTVEVVKVPQKLKLIC